MAKKYAYKGNSITDRNYNINEMISIGRVTSVTDSDDMGRIQVRIKGMDDSIDSDNDLPYVFPMLPKHINILPKIGEAVLVFRLYEGKKYDNRLYVGPIISQPQKLEKDNFFLSSLAGFSFGEVDPDVAHSNLPEANGVFPKKDDIAIQGRDNTDIIFKEGEVLIRAGKHITGEKLKFNSENPAYIQLKNDVVLKKGEDNQPDEKGTVTNVVASKINLITHKDGSPRFNVSGQDDLISDDEMLKIVSEAHPLVFGDKLLDYLKLQRNAFINHVHPYAGKKPQDLAGANDIDKYLEYDLDSLISKNIRIN
jgi:hypothetical protein